MANQAILPNQQSQIQKPKKRHGKGFIITFVLLVVLVSGWAGLTKAGYIPNYFGIDLLCSKKDNPYNIPNDTPTPNEDCKKCIDADGNFNEKTCPSFCILDYKPVIYLYPPQKQQVNVKINYAGNFVVTYPEYNNGWNVTAYPDGKIISLADNKEYSYLFWEGNPNNVNYDLSSGFVVEGKNTIDFLQAKLKDLGLTAKEYNEFIVYWYPQMMNNKYNLIHFATKEEYNDRAILNITPKPDSMLRVFMVFKKLDEKIETNPQEIMSFERKGFTVVEWGGTEIK
ncbi:MAG: hypothetical protein PHT40_00255 [Patescibacteria group bacterium]|nr:hypothetical protein [Patescibacteria group bacterium]